MPTHRKVARYGWKPDLPDPRDRIFNLEEEVKMAHQLPTKVDLAPHMPPIWDQGQLGSCTGHGVARVVEHRAMQEGEDYGTPSRLFIYYEERAIEGTVHSDSGAQIRDGIKVIAGDGAPAETDWPYDISQFAVKPLQQVYDDAVKHKAVIYKRIIPGGRGAPIRTALAAGNPIVFGFSVPQYFEDGSWDPTSQPLPLPGPNDYFIGGHCVVLSGFDFERKRFSVNACQADNSWNRSWGMDGRFWFDAGWFDPNNGLTSDFWVVLSLS